MKRIIYNAEVYNEGRHFIGGVCIEGEIICRVFEGEGIPSDYIDQSIVRYDARGKWLLPGAIDDQVHFREPGLTHKGDIASESAAAVAGGVTSFMDMPNTKPATTTMDLIQEKLNRAAECSVANYSFYIGASNDNIEEIRHVDTSKVCGVKLFMGSSTGNMLVDNRQSLERIFGESPLLVAVHAEKEEVVKANMARYREIYGEYVPMSCHPLIRSEEACYRSSSEAVELATKMNGRLHLLHLSTAKELSLLSSSPLSQKRITGEVCVHHLWFDDRDYERDQERIKWNPAIKSEGDKIALRQGLLGGVLDIVATDHAPHLLSEKQGGALAAASGGPSVQFSLVMMLELAQQGVFTVEQVVQWMCHSPADLFQIHKRGYIREDYFADLVLIDPANAFTVTPELILSKCKWSPFEGVRFRCSVDITFVNGNPVYTQKNIHNGIFGKALQFDR